MAYVKKNKPIYLNGKWNEESITKEADFLLEWAQRDDALVLGTCYGLRGYTYDNATQWAIKHDKFSEAKDRAKTIIGARREYGALKGRLDAGLVKASMAVYDPEYRQFLRDMKKDNLLEEISQEQAAKDISEYIKSRPQVKKSVGKSSK